MITLALLALLQAATPAPAAPAAPPTWVFKQTSNPDTGARSASASIRDPDSGARLILKCDVVAQPILSVQFIPRPPMPAGASRTVTITIDSAKAEMATWQFPGAGGYVDDLPSVYIYATEFAAAKLIQIGLTDDAGAPVGGNFDGPGSDALFRQVFEACGVAYAMPSATAITPPPSKAEGRQ
jgi:hypothetical protein